MAITSYVTDFGGIPSRFNGDLFEWVFDEYMDVLIYVQVLYVLLVAIGPKLMESRKPFNVDTFLIVWNLSLSLYSLGGAISMVKACIFLIQDRGFRKSMCAYEKEIFYDGEVGFWVFTFLMSKIPEMIDTVLLVVRKKPIIFLHWYHHLTVCTFCWFAGHTLIPTGTIFALMNYCVHSVMYFYYFMCAIKMRHLVRPLAPFITGSQLFQMVVGSVVIGYVLVMSMTKEGCGNRDYVVRMGVAMYGSYLVLFAKLFRDLYFRKSKKEKVHGRKAAEKNGVIDSAAASKKEL